MGLSNKKTTILLQFYSAQKNNGGPATCANLLMNSDLKNEYTFIPLATPEDGSLFSYKTFLFFIKAIKKYKPDIFHISGAQSIGFWGVLAAIFVGRTKTVLSIHGLSIDSEGGLKRWLYYHIIEPFELQHADSVFCVCKYAAKREFIQKNAKHLYGFIHNAAPDYSMIDKTKARRKIRSFYNISESDVVITFISRLSMGKGLTTLVNSIHQLGDLPHLVFLIGGIGEAADFVIKALNKEIYEKKVLMLGKVENVGEVLCSSDIFVFPSLKENLPNSLLEASEAGLAIIATNVGGNPEIISNKKTGLLIDSESDLQLTEAIKCLVSNQSLREELGRNAKRNVDEHFSQKEIFGQISKMYNTLL